MCVGYILTENKDEIIGIIADSAWMSFNSQFWNIKDLI